MASFTADMASDTLSSSRKQKNHWKVANRIAELLDINVSQCRQVATGLIRNNKHHTLFGDFNTSKKAAKDAMWATAVAKDVTSNILNSPEKEYSFDYSLVQKVAELSKDHGYENVLDALKLYNKLVKGL